MPDLAGVEWLGVVFVAVLVVFAAVWAYRLIAHIIQEHRRGRH